MPLPVAPLFAPLQVRSLRLKNRIVMSPMTRGFSPGGVPGEDVAAYYARRAAGETGLIITEGVGIDHPSALGDAGLKENSIPELHGTAALAGWKRVVEAVHAAGGVIFPQLWHMGVMKLRGTGAHPEAPPMRPSGVWGPRGRTNSLDPQYTELAFETSAPMREEDIADVIAAYARSAANARAVGFDGIAIHGAHGYMIDNFLWAETNFRGDAWGGDRARRSRFAVEVVKAIRAAIGPELPISLRYSQWKQQDFRARLAQTPQELEEVLGPIADAGVDLFEASTRYFGRAEFEGSHLNLAGWTRKLTGKLSMAVGGVGLNTGYYDTLAGKTADAVVDFDPLLERFGRGEFDLVEVGRALLHDAEWTRKLRDGGSFSPFDKESLRVLA
jgi:2,4-dienoyl-CoA reductase-like NADH-dependent reductase (Old Yellow Enzyme family)